MENGGLKPQETAPEQAGGGILRKSWKLLHGAADSLSGKELPRLVEEFTREMVVVAEGLSEDQARLSQAVGEQARGQDEAAQRMRALEREVADLTRQMADFARRADKRQKGEAGLARILRQATWLAAIIAGAWIVTTLLRIFGG
jgi:ABC-type multidrug transport system fused ATPase/permease subunit